MQFETYAPMLRSDCLACFPRVQISALHSIAIGHEIHHRTR
jgi:hypothetical protein